MQYLVRLSQEKWLELMQISEAKLEKVAVVLLDGPMDGQRFKVPLMPPSKKVPASLDLPLKQPASLSPFALYKLTSEEPVAGFFVYFFAGCSSPDGGNVLYAPDLSDTSASNPAVLDLASQSASHL